MEEPVRESRRDGSTIMIVDDWPTNLALLGEMLRSAGHSVVAYRSGALALAAAERDPPDLILLDVLMPEMDGYEVCRRLKRGPATHEIPVIFLTALNQTDDKLKAFSAGGVDCMAKPFQIDELLARVSAQLKIRTLQESLRVYNARLEKMVERRTAALAAAYERLKGFDDLKRDFLRMIAHELRTPANGVLGIGDLLVSGLADSEENRQLAEMFQTAGDRLRNLVADAATIADLESWTPRGSAASSLGQVIDAVRAGVPHLSLQLDCPPALGSVAVRGDRALLSRALEGAIRLAAALSGPGRQLTLRVQDEAPRLVLRLDLDALSLTDAETTGFLELSSPVRGASVAQALGLLPVVARAILRSIGGDLWMVKREGMSGSLFAAIPKWSEEQSRDGLDATVSLSELPET